MNKQIEKGQLIVTCIDNFMSDWGHSVDRKNKLVFLCDDHAQADIVAANANLHDDMTHVSVTTVSDILRKKINASSDGEFNYGRRFVQVKTANDYPNWYKTGYFK